MIQDEQETFNFYMVEFPGTRDRYGIGRTKEGRYFVKDQELINKLPESLKGQLRTFCLAMKQKGLWTSAPKEPVKIYWE